MALPLFHLKDYVGFDFPIHVDHFFTKRLIQIFELNDCHCNFHYYYQHLFQEKLLKFKSWHL